MAPTIDLRSDTVTLPTPAMREAMAQAAVGDDVFGEDPTINALQQRCAAMMGKEAALFVPTGTMGNLIATTTHCRPGESVILGNSSHIFLNEVGGLAELGGLVAHVLPDAGGKLDPDQVATSIHTASDHTPGTRLICVENSHNYAGGVVSTPVELRRIRAVAERHGLPVHMDGARIFNAAVALGVDVGDLAGAADSVSFCFSKGLAAPVGSLLTGSRAFIERAHRKRKQFGGGMRQAGVLAAAAMVALDTMVDRLAEDHANARRLAEGLARLDGFQVALDTVQTNIVMADLPSAEAAAACTAGLAERGVLALKLGVRRIRFVTHYGITAEDIERTLAGAAQVA
ncbi:MAG: GntG family PLP-dependent aldolase, partial [Chloroflexota bacterium]